MTVEDIKKVVIAGAGTMGASMAQIFAEKGYTVVIYDAFEAGIERGKHLVEINQASLVEAGDITAEESAAIQSRMSFTLGTDDFKDCDIVIESVLERLDVKQDFWHMVGELAKPDCICATNTSGLSINKIFETTKDKSRCCGMHWFNPPHIVPLIEVINNDETKQEVADTVYQLSLKVGKKPIYVKKDALGFIGNRLQAAILREAVYIVEQGIGDYSDVDGAMKYGLGFRYACLGPCEVVDQGGLDVHHHIATYLWEDLSDAKYPSGEFEAIYQAGNYGVKTGKGFYDYSGDKADKAVQARDAMYLAMAKCNPTGVGEEHGYKN
jgi:3-hydroxybutyryl-CoA dehydrogenase